MVTWSLIGAGLVVVDNESPSRARDPQERRRHPRQAAALTVTLRRGDREIRGLTSDLSVSGMKLRGDFGLALGEVVELDLEIPGERELVRLEAEVRWVERGCAVGVQFRAPRAFHIWVIQRYLAKKTT